MAFTVNKLAKASGVSVRTLHYYDEIGLLKPAYYGDNQYRYYKEEQVLLLQQILFYRELGFPLSDIKEMLYRDDFDKMKTLESHKRKLQTELDWYAQLIKTIDTTLVHLRGDQEVELDTIFEGFTRNKKRGAPGALGKFDADEKAKKQKEPA